MKVRVLGIDFDDLGAERAAKAALRGGACFAVTPNALILEDCARNLAHRALIGSASLILPDGAGVVRAAKRLGTPLSNGRVAGIDFAETLLRIAAESGERAFLLGGREGVAARAAERLRERFPNLSIVGTYWGYFDRAGEENRRLIGILRACRPTVLFVCLGYPAQETWIAENLPLLPSVKVSVGLGGSLDVWAGDVRRAPALLQNAGLEWAWRILREPSRLSRLPALIRFARLTRRTARKDHSKMPMESQDNRFDLNNCYENDNFSSKPL